MSMSKDNRQRYSREFKLQAVKRSMEFDKSAAEVARDLEISINQLYKWRDEFEKLGEAGVFPGAGRRPNDPNKVRPIHSGLNNELMRLKKENAQLRMERDILKKSLVFFAKDQKIDSDS